MAEKNKDQAKPDPGAFLDSVADPQRRADAKEVCAMMERLSGHKPAMWGSSIVGFGSYHYKYDSGREGDMARISFSPRAKELVLYLVEGFPRHKELMDRLGKHRTGQSCLYIKSLDQVDRGVLEQLIGAALEHMDEKYPQ